jgi:diacylglycerol kinase family enzyme
MFMGDILAVPSRCAKSGQTNYRARPVRLLLVVNTTASSVTDRTRQVITAALGSGHDLRVAPTDGRGHATRLAREAADRGDDAVLVLGGDGTLNEAANGLVGSDTALGAIPGGSTNVFARTLGLPNDAVEATGVLLDAMARHSIRRVGVGSANGRVFLFHVGVGFDATVVARVERRSHLKRWAGHPWFVASALWGWVTMEDRRRPRFAVELGDRVIDDAHQCMVLNTNPYTYLGRRPLDLAPSANLDAPLSVVTLRSLRIGRTLVLVGRALRGGRRIATSSWVDVATGRSDVELDGYGPMPYQVDGEYLGYVDHLEVSHLPEALNLLVPPAGP